MRGARPTSRRVPPTPRGGPRATGGRCLRRVPRWRAPRRDSAPGERARGDQAGSSGSGASSRVNPISARTSRSRSAWMTSRRYRSAPSGRRRGAAEREVVGRLAAVARRRRHPIPECAGPGSPSASGSSSAALSRWARWRSTISSSLQWANSLSAVVFLRAQRDRASVRVLRERSSAARPWRPGRSPRSWVRPAPRGSGRTTGWRHRRPGPWVPVAALGIEGRQVRMAATAARQVLLAPLAESVPDVAVVVAVDAADLDVRAEVAAPVVHRKPGMRAFGHSPPLCTKCRYGKSSRCPCRAREDEPGRHRERAAFLLRALAWKKWPRVAVRGLAFSKSKIRESSGPSSSQAVHRSQARERCDRHPDPRGRPFGFGVEPSIHGAGFRSRRRSVRRQPGRPPAVSAPRSGRASATPGSSSRPAL